MIKPKRILHVVGAMNRAGTETMIMNMFRNINRNEIQFDFISYSEQDAHYDKEIYELGGSVIKLSKTQSIKEIYDAITKHGPYEAVHAHTLFHCGITMVAALLAGVKIRISHAHTTEDNSNSLVRKIYIYLMSFLINRLSTTLLACSNEAGRYLFGEKGVSTTKYSYFPNAINYDNFIVKPTKEVEQFKQQIGLANSLVVGHIGRFIEAKNHEFLIEVMRSVLKRQPNTKLLLVGDGDLKKQIEIQAKGEGLYDKIHFVGLRDDVATMFHSMDIFVFPSKYEGLGLVLLEAQASGVPCIVSEAIQPEADLGIGLVTKLCLADGPEIWADKVMELKSRKERNLEKIITSFEGNGYDLKLLIPKLIKIYRPNDGGEYEKRVDYLL